MYAYFSELDCPDDFKIYLKEDSFEDQKKRIVSNIFLEDSFFRKYEDILIVVKVLLKYFHSFKKV